jgi:hypothetical protein
MKRLVLLGGLFFFSIFAKVTWVGNSDDGFAPQPGREISPERALELAGPWLDDSFELRGGGRPGRAKMFDKPIDYIVLQGNWYHVSRDNYPYKTIYAYRNHSVRVHSRTGRVIPPK